MLYARGHVYKDPKVVMAEKEIAALARNELIKQRWPKETILLPMRLDVCYLQKKDEMEITLIPVSGEVHRRFDLQNTLDVICDALEQGGVMLNDRQITEINVWENHAA